MDRTNGTKEEKKSIIHLKSHRMDESNEPQGFQSKWSLQCIIMLILVAMLYVDTNKSTTSLNVAQAAQGRKWNSGTNLPCQK